MDVYKALRDLHEEKKRLDAMIASLEKKSGSRLARRRGRKSMGAEERRAVSARMAAYWASRKAATGASHLNGDVPSGQAD